MTALCTFLSSSAVSNHYILPCDSECEAHWVSVAPMHVGRVRHTATLLADGTVLVVGGETGVAGQESEEALQSVENYDPRSNVWRFVSPMHTPRQWHTATLLRDGNVLVVGGMNSSGFLSSVEIYDPRSDTWRPASSMRYARVEHTATLLTNGNVLVAGGGAAGDDNAELYDPVNDTWAYAGVSAGHANHTATLLGDGRVLVAGGSPFAFPAQLTVNAEIYDPAANGWSDAGFIPAAQPHLLWATATALPDGEVMVAGGGDPTDFVLDDVNFYAPATGIWRPGAPLTSARINHSATLMPDGKVLLVGGFSYTSVLASTEFYDPASKQSIPAAELNQARAWHTATLLPLGVVLVVGGFDANDTALSASEMFVFLDKAHVPAKPALRK